MSKKWIKKGSEAEEAGAPAQKAEDEPITSPLLLEKFTGPTYDKALLLGVATAVKKASKAAGDAEQPSVGREVSLTARPDASPDEKTPAERRAQRSAMKEAKASRRSTSQIFGDDEEAAMLDPMVGTLSVNAPFSPAGSMNPAMMSYLQSMTAMYGAYASNPAGYTTVMLRNIPNRYTREMLVERLNKGYKGQFDFVYLPIDFESTCNVGYVFINFRTPFSATAFLTEFHNAETKKVLPGFSSRKICEVSYARVQGLEANIENLRDDKFIDKLSEKPEWQPLFLDAKGGEISFAKMMGSKRPGGKTPKGGMTPGSPGAMGGFMMPTLYGPMMYPPVATSTPAVPSTSLKSILPSATGQSMLMVRGVPPTCMRSDVIDTINEQFAKLYDFLFLPPDSKFQGNKGILFINFRLTEKAEEFTKAFHEKKASECFPKGAPAEGDADKGDEEKNCSVESAKVEIVEGIIARAQTAPPLAKSGVDRSKWQPLLFAPDGEPLTFPLIASPGLQMGKTKSQTAKTPKATKAEAPATPANATEDKAAASAAPAEGAAAEGAEGAAAEGAAEGAAPAEAPKAKAKGEAKGKGEKGAKGGKGKEKGAKGMGKGVVPPSPYGQYPGYPYMGYPYGMHPFAAQQAYNYQLQAHLQARAAAAANAAGAGGDPSKLAPEDKKASLRKQVDFYFSTDNLCKDVYLRQQMDQEGYCKLDLIASFNLVKRKYKASATDIAEAIAASTSLELDGDKTRVRLKDAAARQKWLMLPKSDDQAK